MAFEFSFENLEALPQPVASPAGPASQAGAQHVETGPSPADLIAAAHAEADQIRAMAHAEGFAAGQAEASAMAAAQMQMLAGVASAMQTEAISISERLEAQAVDFGLTLAEKIVASALAVRPALVLDAVSHALRGIVERGRITVLVHPDDLAFVSEAMSRLKAEMGGIDHWEVQAERRVDRGGAVVRHALGNVDAQLETKFQRAREVVETALTEST